MASNLSNALEVQVRDSIARVGGCTITVLSGAHAETTLAVGNSPVTIGAGQNNDLVLFTEDIAGQHCRIAPGRHPLAKYTIYALHGPVELADGTVLRPGELCSLQPDFEIRLGTCKLAVRRSVDPAEYVKPALQAVMFGLFVFTAVTAWNLFSTLPSAVGQSLGSALSMERLEAGLRSVGLQEVLTSSIDRDLAAVRAKLEEMSLHSSVRVLATPDNMLKVTGTISETSLAQWNQFLKWYDTNPQFPRLVRSVAHSSNNDLPQVESVWLSGKPEVFLKGGATAMVGDTIDGGWKVMSIQPGLLVLSRDGSSVTLTF
jgi:hypothetical protein